MPITSLSFFCSDRVVEVQSLVRSWLDLHNCDHGGLTVISLYEIGRRKALHREIESLLAEESIFIESDECLLVRGVGVPSGSRNISEQILGADIRLIIEILEKFRELDDGWHLAFVVESELPNRLRSWCTENYPSCSIYTARPSVASSKQSTALRDSLFAVEGRSNPFEEIQRYQSISTDAMLERVRGYLDVWGTGSIGAPAVLGDERQLAEARSRSPGRWVEIFRNLADAELQDQMRVEERRAMDDEPVIALARIIISLQPEFKIWRSHDGH